MTFRTFTYWLCLCSHLSVDLFRVAELLPSTLVAFSSCNSTSRYEHRFEFTESTGTNLYSGYMDTGILGQQTRAGLSFNTCMKTVVVFSDDRTQKLRHLFNSVQPADTLICTCVSCMILQSSSWTTLHSSWSPTQLGKATTDTRSDTLLYVHFRPSLGKQMRSFFKSVCLHLNQDQDQQDHVCIILMSGWFDEEVGEIYSILMGILKPLPAHGPAGSVLAYSYSLFWRVSPVRFLHLCSLSAQLVTHVSNAVCLTLKVVRFSS